MKHSTAAAAPARILLLPLSAALLFAACAPQHSNRKDQFFKGFLAPVMGKTVAFAVEGDSASQHELEAKAVAQMQKMGLDATEGHPLISSAELHSADGLARLLIQNGFQSIAEVRPKKYSDEVDFDIHLIVGPSYAKYPTTNEPLAKALRVLFQSLIEYGAKAKEKR